MSKITFERQASGNPMARVYLRDATTREPITGKDHTWAGLKIATIREMGATVTEYTQALSDIETITTLGTYQAPSSGKVRFKEVDSAKFPGLYEIHGPQALTGTVDASRTFQGLVHGPAELWPCPFECELVPYVASDGSSFTALAMDADLQLALDGIADVLSDTTLIKGYIDTEVATLVTNVATLLTNLAAVKAKTDLLPSDPADDSDLDTQLTAISAAATAIKAVTDQIVITSKGIKADLNAVRGNEFTGNVKPYNTAV